MFTVEWGVWAIGGVLCRVKKNKKSINYNTWQAIEFISFPTYEICSVDRTFQGRRKSNKSFSSRSWQIKTIKILIKIGEKNYWNQSTNYKICNEILKWVLFIYLLFMVKSS